MKQIPHASAFLDNKYNKTNRGPINSHYWRVGIFGLDSTRFAFRSFRSGVANYSVLLEYDAATLGNSILQFRWNLFKVQSKWDLWWTKWHWDRFFPKYFDFPLSISFHRCSITWKNEKNWSSFPSSSSQGCTKRLKAAVRLQHLLRGSSQKKSWKGIPYLLLSSHLRVSKSFASNFLTLEDVGSGIF
jgi:hypothetical protein